MTIWTRPATLLGRRPSFNSGPLAEFLDPVAATPGIARRLADAAAPDTAAPGTAAPAGRKLAEVARGSTLNLIGAGISAIATIAVTILVTRVFSARTAGAFFSATSLFLVIESLASLGAYTGAVYFVARLRLIGEDSRIGVILRAAIIPVTVASVTAAVALAVFASPLARTLLGSALGHTTANAPAVAVALRALAVTLPFAAMLDTLLGFSRGYRDMRPTVVIDKFGRSVGQLLGVAVAVAAGSAALLAPLWAVAYIPAAAAAGIWFRRLRLSKSADLAARRTVPPEVGALLALATPVRPDGTRLQPGETYIDDRLANANPRGFWRFTGPRGLAILAQTIIQRLDIVLVAILRGPAEAAVYTAATRFLVAGQLGSTAISTASQPQFTELFAMGALRRANVVYHATTAWLILLTWPLYLLILVNGPEFLSIFGHAYQAGTSVLIILALTQLLSSACGQVDMVLITAGRSSWSLFNGLLAMFVNVSLDILLIPRYGITGAAIGWAVAIVLANLIPLVQIAVTSHLYPFGRSMLVACVLSVASFCLIPLAARVILGEDVAGVAAGMAAGAVLMAAGLWYFSGPLRLSVMPGMSQLLRHARKRGVRWA